MTEVFQTVAVVVAVKVVGVTHVYQTELLVAVEVPVFQYVHTEAVPPVLPLS